MPYRDVQSAIIAALADHSRPGHSSWQDDFDAIRARMAGKERLADIGGPPVMVFRTGLSGMEEVAGEAALVQKHMSRMQSLVQACLLIMAHNTQWPSPIYDEARKVVEHEAVVLLNLHMRRLLERCIKEALHPSKDGDSRLPINYIATKTGAHRNTVRGYWQRVLPWVCTERKRGYAELTDRLEGAGLIGRDGI